MNIGYYLIIGSGGLFLITLFVAVWNRFMKNRPRPYGDTDPGTLKRPPSRG